MFQSLLWSPFKLQYLSMQKWKNVSMKPSIYITSVFETTCSLKKCFFMKDLDLITTLNHHFASISISFRKKNKNVIHQLSFVRIGKNHALCLECWSKTSGTVFFQYGPPSWWITYIHPLKMLALVFSFGNTVNREYMDHFPLLFVYLYARLTL